MRYFFCYVLISLVACTQQTPVPQIVDKPDQDKSAELTDSLILTTIFGKAQKHSERDKSGMPGQFYASYLLDSTQFSLKNWKALSNSGLIEYTVESIENIIEDRLEKKLVILNGLGQAGHICPGVCGAAVFSKKNDLWNLECWKNGIAVLGNYGVAVDQVDICPFHKNAYAIFLKRGGLWQGVEFRIFTLVIYEKGSFHEMIKEPIPFSSNNWAACPNLKSNSLNFPIYCYTSNVEFDWHSSNQVYPDMLLHFQGTTINSNTSRPELLDKVIRFKFTSDQYYKPNEKIPGVYE